MVLHIQFWLVVQRIWDGGVHSVKKLCKLILGVFRYADSKNGINQNAKSMDPPENCNFKFGQVKVSTNGKVRVNLLDKNMIVIISFFYFSCTQRIVMF